MHNSNAEKRELIVSYAKAKRDGVSVDEKVCWQPVSHPAWRNPANQEPTYLVSDGGVLAKHNAYPELERALLTIDRHFHFSFELDSPEDVKSRFGVKPFGNGKEVVTLANRQHLLTAVGDLEDLIAVIKDGLRF